MGPFDAKGIVPVGLPDPSSIIEQNYNLWDFSEGEGVGYELQPVGNRTRISPFNIHTGFKTVDDGNGAFYITSFNGQEIIESITGFNTWQPGRFTAKEFRPLVGDSSSNSTRHVSLRGIRVQQDVNSANNQVGPEFTDGTRPTHTLRSLKNQKRISWNANYGSGCASRAVSGDINPYTLYEWVYILMISSAKTTSYSKRTRISKGSSFGELADFTGTSAFFNCPAQSSIAYFAAAGSNPYSRRRIFYLRTYHSVENSQIPSQYEMDLWANYFNNKYGLDFPIYSS